MNINNSYKWDIFISYHRLPAIEKWLKEILIPLLELHLPSSLGREADIFCDDNIKTGNHWPNELSDALAYSKVLLPIWTVLYFHREWCLKEWLTMVNRESKLNSLSREEQFTLIKPIRLLDGNKYPIFAQNTQSLTCTNYFTTSECYKQTLEYINLEKKITDWCNNDLGQSIVTAPPCQEFWLNEEFSRNSIRALESQSEMQPIDLNTTPRLGNE